MTLDNMDKADRMYARLAHEWNTCPCTACKELVGFPLMLLNARREEIAYKTEAALARHQDGCHYHRYLPHN